MSKDTLIEKIKKKYKDVSDLMYRDIEVGHFPKRKISLVFSDTISDKQLICESIIEPLTELKYLFYTPALSTGKILSIIDASNIEIFKTSEFSKICQKVEYGECILYAEASHEVIVIETKKYPVRTTSDPKSKSIIEGPKEGFTESINANIGLMKKRLRSERFEVKTSICGDKVLNSVAVFSLKGVTNPGLKEKVQFKIDENQKVDITSLDDLMRIFTGGRFSFLPLIEATERTDEAVNAVLSGHVVVILDNNPFAIILPGTLKNMMSTSESRARKVPLRKTVLYSRMVVMLVSMILPAVYIAIVQYNPEFLSDKLILLINISRQSVPFPPFFEIFFIEIIFEAIIEASIRMPEKISFTISIVGSLILGQAIVDANIVNPFVVVLIAITSILTFTVPNHQISKSIRILKFAFMIAASVLGFYGIELLLLIVVLSICSTNILGVNYMESFIPRSK